MQLALLSSLDLARPFRPGARIAIEILERANGTSRRSSSSWHARLSAPPAIMSDAHPHDGHPNDGNLDGLLERGYRFAVSLSGDPERAQDLLHDACLRVLPRPHAWNVPYLFTVIRNLAIDQSRRSGHVHFVAPAELPEEASEDRAGTGLDDGWDDTLERALQQLSLDQREVLHLTVVEGLTAREVATITGRPRGTVLSLAHRAKLRLRDLLSEGEQDA